jgi:two-component system sensor histidine kinase/response regulator
VTSRLGADGFHLSVQDWGCGMRPEEVACIGVFVQFNRERQEQRGVGLGLYLAGRIAGLYGGSLAVASVARQGTTVTLRFPKAEVAAA